MRDVQQTPGLLNTSSKKPRREPKTRVSMDRSEGYEGIIDICWHCSGTGTRFVSMSPLKFRTCPICSGRGGKRCRADRLFDSP